MSWKLCISEYLKPNEGAGGSAVASRRCRLAELDAAKRESVDKKKGFEGKFPRGCAPWGSRFPPASGADCARAVVARWSGRPGSASRSSAVSSYL